MHVCVGLAIHTYAGRQVSRSMGLWGGYMLLFGCLSFCLSVVLESLNLGDAGDLGSRDSQTLLHIRITWEVLILLCPDQAPDH